ncbi:hypothetical protein OEZ85_009265 [Tetradesmus obliquus]|uniref:Uncharacterized protein n=1 Tax=Tetradesmus obliquus TaxID=3088 RepID=A0ABY8U8G0_TETOB|nr:hypothetical protein OEZ85_009265 [Tetradesmus obliquus]
MAVAAPGALGARPKMDSDKMEVCHYDVSQGKFVLLNVSVSVWKNGHSHHDRGELKTDCCMHTNKTLCPDAAQCPLTTQRVIMVLDRKLKTCVPSCSAVPEVEHVSFTCGSMAVGSQCIGTCENGYEGSPQSTVPVATCGATGFTVTGEYAFGASTTVVLKLDIMPVVWMMVCYKV